MTQRTARGADALVGALRALNVDTVFSLSGNQIMPVYDACFDAGIRIVHTRHEAAAVFMADAWSQITGGLGVAMVTAGPGLGNALGALYAARMADSAVMLLAGDSPLGQDGQGAFQTLDQVAMCTPVTKHSRRSAGPDALANDVFALASMALGGRRGPVHLALPADALEAGVTSPLAPATLEERAHSTWRTAQGTAPASQAVARCVDTVRRAKRPLILTGPMLSPSRLGKAFESLEQACDAPAICIDSSRGLRDPAQANLGAIIAASDCLLLLGRQPDFSTGFLARQDERTVLVADDAASMLDGIGQTVTETISVSPHAMVKALVEAGAHRDGQSAPAALQNQWARRVRATLNAREVSVSGDAPFVPALDALQTLIDAHPDAILIIDGGEFGQWAQARLRARTRIVNGMSGAIGGGPAYAIAASLARPSVPVFLLMGDGSAGFHLPEFETAVRVGARFVAIVGNDSQWHAESLIQARDYGPERQFACELSPQTRYDQVVVALGGYGERVDNSDDLAAAVRRALTAGTASCIDWRIAATPAPEYPKPAPTDTVTAHA